jgi:LEA14-like dessication related protein
MRFHNGRNALIASCLGLFILVFSACSLPGQRVEPPRITLSSIKIQDINLFEAVLHIEVRVVNPQNASYEIKGIDCVLDLDQVKLASGVSNTPTRIPSLDAAIIPLTVYSSVEDITKCLKELKGKDKINYNIKGKLHLAGGFLKPSLIAFNTDGQISLQGLKDLKL